MGKIVINTVYNVYMYEHAIVKVQIRIDGAIVFMTPVEGVRCICLCMYPIPMLLLWTTQILPL